MVRESTKKAAEVTGALRYWSLQDMNSIVAAASGGLPEVMLHESAQYAALSKAYWRRARGSGPGLLAGLFGKKDTSIPETREGIAQRARLEGAAAIWAILEPAFSERETAPDLASVQGFGNILVELGPTAVAIAISAFKHEGFSSQQSFHHLGMAFLNRAKLLTALVVSLAGEDALAGERIALASVSASGGWEKSLRTLLNCVANLPGYDVPVHAALAKLDEYSKKGTGSFYEMGFRPHESREDVVSSQQRVPGGVEH